jgi:hypothetical protein
VLLTVVALSCGGQIDPDPAFNDAIGGSAATGGTGPVPLTGVPATGVVGTLAGGTTQWATNAPALQNLSRLSTEEWNALNEGGCPNGTNKFRDASCNYFVYPDPGSGTLPSPDTINIVYEVNGAEGNRWLIGRALGEDCPEINGWNLNYTDNSNLTVQLCPATCDLIRQDPSPTVYVFHACSLVPIVD